MLDELTAQNKVKKTKMD